MRKLLAGLALLAILGALAFIRPTDAQDATPTATEVVVKPPSKEGCGDINELMADLRQVEEEARERWAEDFPDATYVADMSEDEYLSFLMARSPEQFSELAEFVDWRIKEVLDIDVPAIAEPFINARIERQRVIANFLRDAGTMGLLAAGIAYGDEADRLEDIQDAQGQAALSVCSDFQQVIDYYAIEDDGTPEAG